MKIGWVVLALVACTQGKKPEPQTGSGSAIAAPNECEVGGTYRLRFQTNGTDGWSLLVKVTGRKAEILAPQEMLDLVPGPIDLAVDASCRLALTKHTAQAGDLAIKVAADAKGTVTGQLSRTAHLELGPATTPVTGVREAAPPKLPACLHPGAFRVRFDPKPRWKLDGEPFGGRMHVKNACKDLVASASVILRVEALGDVIVVDGAGSEAPYTQGFERGAVTRSGECAITLSIEMQDFKIHDAKLVLDGDRITGTAKARVEMFEDGEAGENLWACEAPEAPVIGERVGS